MMQKALRAWAAPLCAAALLAFLATDAAARGRGGGGRGGGFGGRGNISRSGPASYGSMRSGRASMGGGGSFERPTTRPSDRPSTRPGDRPGAEPGGTVDQRQDHRNDRFDDRQNNRNDRYEDRRRGTAEYRGERSEMHEFYEDRWRYRVGASISAASFRSLQCASSSVVVNGVTYYNCGSGWYQRGYSGGSVTYIVVNAPAGH